MSSSKPVASSSPHSSARNTASDGCKPCALAVKFKNVHRILRTIHHEGIKALSAHHCECIDASARGHHIVPPLPHHVDVFVGDRCRIEIENFRTITSSRISCGIAFIFGTVGRGERCVWPFGAMGESPANAHRNHRPMSPLPTGRHKHMY